MGHRRSTTSMDANIRTSKKNIFFTQDLIVNNQPDLPLRVSLDAYKLPAAEKISQMKQNNLGRMEAVARNLQMNAEREKDYYVARLKKKKINIQ